MKKLLFLLTCILLSSFTSCTDGIKSSEVEFLQDDNDDVYVYYKGKLYDGMVYREEDDYYDRYELTVKKGLVKKLTVFDGNGKKYFESTPDGGKVYYDDKGKIVPKELYEHSAACWRTEIRGNEFVRDIQRQPYTGDLPNDD